MKVTHFWALLMVASAFLPIVNLPGLASGPACGSSVRGRDKRLRK